MGTENIKLGTCRITYGDDELGLTAGGVEVTVETNTYEVAVDQYGETVVKEIITGRNVTVSVPMAETTIDNLVLVMPGATKVTDQSDQKKIKVDVKTGIGTDLRKGAKKLLLTPIGLTAATDGTGSGGAAGAITETGEDFTIPLAATPGGINFAYMIDQVRVYQANFKGYPDDTGVLFTYGAASAKASA